MQHPHLESILAELRTGLYALYGQRLTRLVLYGSQARAEADVHSDIDVLVVLEGPVSRNAEIERTSDLVWRLSLKHDTVISRFFKSKAAFESERSPLLMNVRREGVRL